MDDRAHHSRINHQTNRVHRVNWTIDSIDNFDQHRDAWDTLNAENSDSPLLSSKFVAPLIANFGAGNEVLAHCELNGRICCMAILEKNRVGSWQTFQPSQAPVGSWLQSSEASTAELASSLRGKLSGAWLMLGITQLDPALLPRPESSSSLTSIDYIETAHIPVTGSFDEYWAERGKNLRQNLRRQRNRLAREEVETQLSIIQDIDAIHDGVKAYGEMESAGWKNESNTAIHIDNAQGKFYEQLLKNFAQSGDAFIFQYRYNGELVTTDLCIRGGGSFIILKTTYDESITTSSPAMLMREDAFNHIFTEQLAQRIEFYGKAMEWHKRWAKDIRTMYHVNSYSTIGSSLKRLRAK